MLNILLSSNIKPAEIVKHLNDLIEVPEDKDEFVDQLWSLLKVSYI